MLGRCNRLRSNFIKNQNNSLGPAGAWFGSVSPKRGVRRPDMALQFTKMIGHRGTSVAVFYWKRKLTGLSINQGDFVNV
jgi:hypothetical protein